MSVEKTVAELFSELEKATEQHKDAELAESQARSVLTDAVNRLNRAQKSVDEHMAKLRKAAPWNTDWKLLTASAPFPDRD